jgi:hypothetical protein
MLSSTIPEDLKRMQAIITAEKLRTNRVHLPDYDKNA